REVIGERDWRRCRAGQRRRQLLTSNSLRIAPRSHPTNAIPGGETFRERRAMQDQASLVESLRRQSTVGAAVELAVDVIFNERHIMAREQLYQLLLLTFGQRAAHRILECRHQPA